MGRGSAHGTAQAITLRRPAPGSAAPLWWQPAARPSSAAAAERVARQRRKIAREMFLHARAVKDRWPHPVPIHEGMPLLAAVRDLALSELAQIMYCTPARVSALVGDEAVSRVDAELGRWARRELHSQLVGVFEHAGPVAHAELVGALSGRTEPAAWILGTDRTLTPRPLTVDEWQRLLDDPGARRDPRRALAVLLAGR